MALVARLLPEVTDDDNYAALLTAQAYLLSLGITGWQDAIIGAHAGQRSTRRRLPAGGRAGTLRANVVGAMWWDRGRGLEQLAGAVVRPAGSGRPLPRDQRQDDAGRRGGKPHRRDARALPGRPMGARPATAGLDFIDPANCRGSSPRWTTRASRFTSTPSATARSGTPWTRSRPPARERPWRAASPGPPAGRAPRDIAASPGSTRPPTSSRCGPRTSRRWTSSPSRSSASAGRLAVSVRLAARRGGRPCAGSDWPVSSPDPLLGVHVAVNQEPARQRGRNRPGPVPARAGHRPGHGAGRLHLGQRQDERPRIRHRLDQGRP